MSLNAGKRQYMAKGFPRSRGDEPSVSGSSADGFTFSPLTRG